GDDYWIWQPGVGGIRFRGDQPECLAFPSETVSQDWFEHLVSRSWLPAVFHVWGRQVLHASAVAWASTGEVVAFTGPSGAGKSTLAFGLGRRPGWHQVADDTLAFSWAETREGQELLLHPLQNDTRLRPASAEYFGRSVHRLEAVRWPDTRLTLARVYVLEAAEDDGPQRAATIEGLKASECYTRLLEQAHAMTLKVPAHNHRLMRDYLQLAATVPCLRLRYRKSFDALEPVLTVLERSCGTMMTDEASASPAC
ncbi:MAG: hypothetical protein ACT4QD_21945, partial [Acidobacteriota bacterium]